MPAGVSAYVPLANVTLSSSAASVTFSSINQGFRDLVLVMTPFSSANYIYMAFNGATTADYPTVSMYGSGSDATSYAALWTGGVTFGYQLSGNGSIIVANIMDYSTTDKHKTVLIRSGRADMGVAALVGRYQATAAVTSLTLRHETIASFSAGSTFALYGVSA